MAKRAIRYVVREGVSELVNKLYPSLEIEVLKTDCIFKAAYICV